MPRPASENYSCPPFARMKTREHSGSRTGRGLSAIDPTRAGADLTPHSPACAGAQTEPDPAHGAFRVKRSRQLPRSGGALPDAHAHVDLRAPPREKWVRAAGKHENGVSAFSCRQN